MLTRRRFLRSVMTSGAAGLLGACGVLAGGEEPVAVAPLAGAGAAATIRFWHWDAVFGEVVASFQRAHPTITVEAEERSFGDAHQSFQRALAAGSGAPDVFLTELGILGQLGAAEGLADLAAAPFDGAGLKESFIPSLWGYGQREGRQIAMPWSVGTGAAWYRADIFEAVGLEADPARVAEQVRTWDDWFALDLALRRANPDITLIANAIELFDVAVEQQGHGWMDGDRLLVVEKGTPAAERVAQARENEAAATFSQVEWDRRMRAGEIAGMLAGSYMRFLLMRNHPQTAGAWRVIPAPGGPFNFGALFLVIPQQSQQQEAAWAFVKFLCASVEGQAAIYRAGGTIPVFTPAWDDPIYREPVEFFGGQAAGRVWLDAAAGMPPGLSSPHDQQIGEIVRAKLNDVVYGGKEPAKAMEEAEAQALKQIPGAVA